MKSVIPKCPKCEGTEFASVPIRPKGSNIMVGAVCCAQCGSVLGLQELMSIVFKVGELEQQRACASPNGELPRTQLPVSRRRIA